LQQRERGSPWGDAPIGDQSATAVGLDNPTVAPIGDQSATAVGLDNPTVAHVQYRSHHDHVDRATDHHNGRGHDLDQRPLHHSCPDRDHSCPDHHHAGHDHDTFDYCGDDHHDRGHLE
jgi:hypothetical protein